ncbi:MAG: hypothetical protein ACREH4_07680 [Vitreimonas sp.]
MRPFRRSIVAACLLAACSSVEAPAPTDAAQADVSLPSGPRAAERATRDQDSPSPSPRTR